MRAENHSSTNETMATAQADGNPRLEYQNFWTTYRMPQRVTINPKRAICLATNINHPGDTTILLAARSVVYPNAKNLAPQGYPYPSLGG